MGSGFSVDSQPNDEQSNGRCFGKTDPLVILRPTGPVGIRSIRSIRSMTKRDIGYLWLQQPIKDKQQEWDFDHEKGPPIGPRKDQAPGRVSTKSWHFGQCRYSSLEFEESVH